MSGRTNWITSTDDVLILRPASRQDHPVLKAQDETSRAVTGRFLFRSGEIVYNQKREPATGSEMTLMSEASPNWRIDTPADTERYARSTTPAIEPAPIDTDAEIQARARKIRAMPIGERIYMQGQILGRIRTMERNQKNGYDWSRELEVERKVLELSRMGMM
jgi:hypothetical protein